MSKADKLDATGDKMKELGKLIQGIVWGSLFIALLVWIGWQVTFG